MLLNFTKSRQFSATDLPAYSDAGMKPSGYSDTFLMSQLTFFIVNMSGYSDTVQGLLGTVTHFLLSHGCHFKRAGLYVVQLGATDWWNFRDHGIVAATAR